MYPAAVIRGRVLRGAGLSPCLGEILHHVPVGHVLEHLGIAYLVQDPAGDSRRYEVDELRSDQREVVLDSGAVEAFVVLVAVEDKLEKPSVAVASVGDGRIHVLVGFEYRKRHVYTEPDDYEWMAIHS